MEGEGGRWAGGGQASLTERMALLGVARVPCALPCSARKGKAAGPGGARSGGHVASLFGVPGSGREDLACWLERGEQEPCQSFKGYEGVGVLPGVV